MSQRASDLDLSRSHSRSEAHAEFTPPSSAHPRSYEQLPPLTEVTNGSQRPASRLAGVSSLLNPPVADEAAPPDNHHHHHNHHRSVPQPKAAIDQTQSTLPPIVSGPVHHRSADPRDASPKSNGIGEHPRRILTPRSLRGGPTLGQPDTNGSVNTQHSLFATSPSPSAYAAQMVQTTVAPLPLPTPPPMGHQSSRLVYAFPDHSSMRRASNSSTPYYAPTLSSSASPNTSYALGEPTDRQRPASIPISSTGGTTVYQMMTVETGLGSVQLPVDVQAASRAADEKRRRNAGASARFRQRRKEKEREASTTIARLELEAKRLADELDFYRHERDYLASVLRSIPGCNERYFPRPASPHTRRASSLSTNGMSSNGNPGYAASSPEEGGRNVRRRTSPYPVSSARQPHHDDRWTPEPSSHPQGPGNLQSPLALQSRERHGSQADAPGAPLPPHLQTLPQPGPWNPYTLERRPSGAPGMKLGTR